MENLQTTEMRITSYANLTEYEQHLVDENKVCGAAKGDGGICMSRNLYDNGKCKFHGGKSPSGVDHYRAGSLMYSKHIPTRLKDRFLQLAQDDDIMSTRSDMALIASRVEELLEKSDFTAGKEDFEKIVFQFTRFKYASSIGDAKGAKTAMNELGLLIETINKDMSIWTEIYESLELKRRLAETERRRLEALSLFIPVDRVMTMMTSLSNIVQRHIEGTSGMLMTDKLVAETINKIAKDFEAMTRKQ